LSLYNVWWIKGYFGILDNLCIWQKIISWFSEGQKFRFLFNLLVPSLFSSRNSFEIKHSTTEIVIFNLYFLSNQTHSITIVIPVIIITTTKKYKINTNFCRSWNVVVPTSLPTHKKYTRKILTNIHKLKKLI
jgi:hypothetical protein